MLRRPGGDEYFDYYAGYIDLVPDGDVVGRMETQRDELAGLLRAVPEDRGDYRYADGKWTLKEVVGHMIDTERVFAYRLLVIARGDQTPQAGFEQDDYVTRGFFRQRTIADLIVEFVHHRNSVLSLLRSLPDEAWERRGTASDCTFSARSIPYIMVGHVMHHLEVLRGRYLGAE